jgi:uncharacterized protein YcbX
VFSAHANFTIKVHLYTRTDGELALQSRFRGNVVVGGGGAAAWAEDTWRLLRISGPGGT